MSLTLNSKLTPSTPQQDISKISGEINHKEPLLISSHKIQTHSKLALNRTTNDQVNRLVNAGRPLVTAFNEAITLGETAKHALDEIRHTLNKIRHLTVEVITNQTSVQNTDAFNGQLLELKKEINAIVANHRYQNKALLQNGFSQSFPVDTDHGNTINLTLADLTIEHLGVTAWETVDLPDLTPLPLTDRLTGTVITKKPKHIDPQQPRPKTLSIDSVQISSEDSVFNNPMKFTVVEYSAYQFKNNNFQIKRHPRNLAEKTLNTNFNLNKTSLKIIAGEINWSLKNTNLVSHSSFELHRFTQHFSAADQVVTTSAPLLQFNPQSDLNHNAATFNFENKSQRHLASLILANINLRSFTTDSKQTNTIYSTVSYGESHVNAAPDTTHYPPPSLLSQPTSQLNIKSPQLGHFEIPARNATVVNFGQYSVTNGDLISFASPGQSKVQGHVNNDGIETLLDEMAIHTTETMPMISKVTVNQSILILTHQPSHPQLDQLRITIEPQAITLSTQTVKTFDFNSVPLKQGDPLLLTVSGVEKVQESLINQDIGSRLTQLAMALTEIMPELSYQVNDRGLLTLTDQTGSLILNDLEITFKNSIIKPVTRVSHTVDFSQQPFNSGDQLTITDKNNNQIQGTLVHHDLNQLLKTIAKDAINKLEGISAASTNNHMLRLTTHSNTVLHDLAITLNKPPIILPLTPAKTFDFTKVPLKKGDHSNLTISLGDQSGRVIIEQQNLEAILTKTAQLAIKKIDGINDTTINNNALTLMAHSHAELSHVAITFEQSLDTPALTTNKTVNLSTPRFYEPYPNKFNANVDGKLKISPKEQNDLPLLTEFSHGTVEEITEHSVTHSMRSSKGTAKTRMIGVTETQQNSNPTTPLILIKQFDFNDLTLTQGDQVSLIVNGDQKASLTLEDQSINTLLNTLSQAAFKQHNTSIKTLVNKGILSLSGFKNHHAITQTYIEIKRPNKASSLANISLLDGAKARQSLHIIDQAIIDVTAQQLLLKTFQSQIHHAFSKLNHADKNLSLLTQGDLSAVVVKETKPLLIVESKSKRFQGPSQKGLKVGQKLLLKVTDSTTLPPKIKLFKATDAALLQLINNTDLQTLLTQEQPLLAVEKALKDQLIKADLASQPTLTSTTFTNEPPVDKEPLKSEKTSATETILNAPLIAPEKFTSSWVQQQLQHSGLFYENNAFNKTGPATSDLKQLFLLLQREDPGNQELSKALDGISASQVKAVDADLQGGSYYSLLLPFLPNEFITLTLVQDQVQKINQQWHIYLESNTLSMGHFKVDIVLQKKTVAIQFRSNQDWLVSLIDSSKERLVDRVENAGMSVSGITAQLSKKPTGEQTKISPTDQAEHALMSAKKQINQQTEKALQTQANLKKQAVLSLLQ